MTWLTNLENVEFTIVTGDGAVFTPLWKDAQKSKSYNVTKYDFINLEGSFVDRKKPQGSAYPLVFWFQGEDNIDKSQSFENSSDDNRAWTVTHPFYGTIKGHPVSISRSDVDFNVTQITVEFLESIDTNAPNASISTVDEARKKVNVINLQALGVVSEDLTAGIENINILQEQLNLTTSNLVVPNDMFDDFSNLINTAKANIDNVVQDAEAAYEAIQEIYVQASEYQVEVMGKVDSYILAYDSLKQRFLDQYGNLVEQIQGVFDKINFEIQAAAQIAAMCNSAVNPLVNDFITRVDVQEVIDAINTTYSDYLLILDQLQIPITNVANSWTSSARVQRPLADLIAFTLSSLFELSFESKQERTIELRKDSNLIVLTHRFLGLDINDENIEKFRQLNNIKNNELLGIKKGRTIKYFV